MLRPPRGFPRSAGDGPSGTLDLPPRLFPSFGPTLMDAGWRTRDLLWAGLLPSRWNAPFGGSGSQQTAGGVLRRLCSGGPTRAGSTVSSWSRGPMERIASFFRRFPKRSRRAARSTISRRGSIRMRSFRRGTRTFAGFPAISFPRLRSSAGPRWLSRRSSCSMERRRWSSNTQFTHARAPPP